MTGRVLLPCAVAGSGDRPPLVFLHGWTLAGDIFADAFARLSGTFHCVAPDLPGHGTAPASAPGYPVSVEGAAQAVGDLLAARDLRGAVLVGWSLGALIAWRCLEQPEVARRVAGMVSVDMSPRPLNGPGWNLGLQHLDAVKARAATSRFRSHWGEAGGFVARGMFGADQGAPLLSVEDAKRRVAANNPEAMADMWASLIEQDCRPIVDALPVPMLVIHGARSRLYGADTAAWLAATAPRAETLCFVYSGHAPHLEEPDLFATAVGDFARGLL